MAVTSQIRCREFSRSIAPNGEAIIEVSGTFFRLKESSAAVQVGTDTDPLWTCDVGMGFRCTLPGDFFQLVRLKNTGAITVSVVVLVGSGEIIDDRLNLVRDRGAICAIEPATRIAAQTLDLDPQTAQALPETLTPGDLRRKAVVISNRDGTNNRLEVRDAGSVCFNIILPGESAYIAVSGYVEIYNPSPASPISVSVGEIYWQQ